MKRIFAVSSVQREFAEVRKLLKRYIGRNPAYRRLFSTFVFEEDVVSMDRRTDEVYLDELRHCDIYLCLIGNEYGFEDAEGTWPESWPESWPGSWPESWPKSNENKVLSLLWFGEKSNPPAKSRTERRHRRCRPTDVRW